MKYGYGSSLDYRARFTLDKFHSSISLFRERTVDILRYSSRQPRDEYHRSMACFR